MQFVLNNDSVIQLEGGRILVPVTLHYNNGDDFQERDELFCCYSDDNRKTWVSSAEVPDTCLIYFVF